MASFTRKEKFDREQEDLEKDLESRVNSDNLPAANIIVAGMTGTGKSTLINAIFGNELAATGSGKPVTQHINEYRNPDIPIHIWDTIGLELDQKNTQDSIASIKATIASKSGSKDKYDKIHAIWYCVNSGSNRYQGAELEFIRELNSIGVPFIIVLTQCSGAEDEVNEFESEIRKINASMGMGDIDIVQVLARPVKLRGMTESIESFGLDDLVNLTLKKLPEFIKGGFIAAQRQDLSLKREACEEIIFGYVEGAYNGFWDKVPLINVCTTDDKIKKMFKKIGTMYNAVLTEDSIQRLFKECGVDFKNNFWGLISPIDMGYSKKVARMLSQKKKDGFSVKSEEMADRDRTARMIAFYGYTFVESIERLWNDLTEEDLKNVDYVIEALIKNINDILQQRKSKGVR